MDLISRISTFTLDTFAFPCIKVRIYLKDVNLHILYFLQTTLRIWSLNYSWNKILWYDLHTLLFIPETHWAVFWNIKALPQLYVMPTSGRWLLWREEISSFVWSAGLIFPSVKQTCYLSLAFWEHIELCSKLSKPHFGRHTYRRSWVDDRIYYPTPSHDCRRETYVARA